MKFTDPHHSLLLSLRIRIIWWHYQLCNRLLKVLAQLCFDKVHQPRKLLIVRKGNLGDLLCSLPVFHAIRKQLPDAEIILLTTHGGNAHLGFEQLFGKAVFDEVWEASSISAKEIKHKIRQKGIEAVLELPQDVDTLYTQIRNLLFFKWCGMLQGGGWQVSNTLLFRKTQLRYFKFPNEQDRLKQIVTQHGFHAVQDSYVLESVVTADEKVIGLLHANGFHRKEKCIAIAPGAKLERKKWPIAYFYQLTDWLISKGFYVVVVGDKADAQNWKYQASPQLLNTCGLLTVQESAALLKQCFLCICNDSGPMHLSYTAGTPVVALFSARNYLNKWFPPANGLNKVFIHTEVSCAICRDKACASNICMQQITPVQVIEYLRQTLSVNE